MSDENYTGVTTGTVATACSLAAIDAIIDSPDIVCVNVETPKKTLGILIDDCRKLSDDSACAVAHKNPYNDPDVTVNLDIVAHVELINFTDYAINPVPRKMIKKNLKDKVPEGKSAKVTISIPKGREIAKKTMNPKLGIVDGISILGTTGIARSMSSEAYKNSIVTQIDVAIASDLKDLLFVPGNIGEKLALKRMNITKEQIIQTGNYVGFMFEEAKKRGIDKFTYFGHIGKLIKVAGGIFNTKHAVADGRREIMITHAAICGAEKKVLEKLYDSATTDDMLDILNEINLQKDVANSIAIAIKQRCMQRFELDIDVILVDMEGNYLNDNMEGFL